MKDGAKGIKIKVFETNAGLGFQQKAYFIRVDADNYLCIGGKNLLEDDCYIIGELADGFDTEESSFKITDSPLQGSFLFDFFLDNV